MDCTPLPKTLHLLSYHGPGTMRVMYTTLYTGKPGWTALGRPAG